MTGLSSHLTGNDDSYRSEISWDPGLDVAGETTACDWSSAGRSSFLIGRVILETRSATSETLVVAAARVRTDTDFPSSD
jgi:hypothetical protein